MKTLVRSTSIVLTLSACTATGPVAVREPGHTPVSVRATSTGVDVNHRPDREVVTEVIQATAERTWDALFLAYEEMGIPVKEADADLLIMGNPRFVVSRRLNGVRLANYLECGQGPAGYNANTHRVEMELRSSILPAGEDGVRVSTYVGARARNVDGTSNTVVACASKLRLERELADRVAAIVGGSGIEAYRLYLR